MVSALTMESPLPDGISIDNGATITSVAEVVVSHIARRIREVIGRITNDSIALTVIQRELANLIDVPDVLNVVSKGE